MAARLEISLESEDRQGETTWSKIPKEKKKKFHEMYREAVLGNEESGLISKRRGVALMRGVGGKKKKKKI